MESFRTIYMEQSTSRVPSVVPAYKDGVLYYFREKDVSVRNWEYPTNYGMIPLDWVYDLTKIFSRVEVRDNNRKVIHFISKNNRSLYTYTVEKDVLSCFISKGSLIIYYEDETSEHVPLMFIDYIRNKMSSDGYGPSIGHDEDMNFRWSFATIMEMHRFYRDYDALVDGGGNCGLSFSSSTQYYTHEAPYNESGTSNFRFNDDLRYGPDISTYLEMDEVFNRYGGRDFYDKVISKIIPCYKIQDEYVDAWDRRWLMLPDVLEAMSWLEKMKDKYGSVSICSSLTSTYECCECSEYKAKGGNTILSSMKSWKTSIYTYVNKVTEAFRKDIERPRELHILVEYGSNSGSVAYSGDIQYNPFHIDHVEYGNVKEYTLSPDKIVQSGTVLSAVSVTKVDYRNDAWINVYDSSFSYDPHTLIGENLQTIVYDLGNESTFSEKYDSKKSYSIGNVADIDGYSMILSGSGNPTSFDPMYMVRTPSDDWKPLTDGYMAAYSGVAGNVEVCGVTSSRLAPMISRNLLVDDIGNTIEGVYEYEEGDLNYQPEQDSVLKMAFKTGNTANLTPFKDMLMGDMITNMSFYYIDSMNNRVDFNDQSEAEEFSGGVVHCDVEYVIGATLEGYTTDGHAAYRIKEGYDSGVTYYENVRFVKTRVEYYLKGMDSRVMPMEENIPSKHSVSYPIYIWELSQDQSFVGGGTYGNYFGPIASFKASVNPKGCKEDMCLSSTTTSFPTFREPYMIGTSSYQNVDADIYIDRGINAAFELHLKLGEVSSLDSLVKYGNGFFSITED